MGITDYIAKMIENIDNLPPIELFIMPNGKYFIIDGHTRYCAHIYAKYNKIKYRVVKLKMYSDQRGRKYMRRVLREVIKMDLENLSREQLIETIKLMRKGFSELVN